MPCGKTSRQAVLSAHVLFDVAVPLIIPDSFTTFQLLAPEMLALACTNRKDGEVLVVGKIQFFWASVLHAPTCHSLPAVQIGKGTQYEQAAQIA
jgi:hypothetical protein